MLGYLDYAGPSDCLGVKSPKTHFLSEGAFSELITGDCLCVRSKEVLRQTRLRMGRQTGNYGHGKQCVNGYTKKEYRFSWETCNWDSSCNTSALQHKGCQGTCPGGLKPGGLNTMRGKLKHYEGKELCLGLPEIGCDVGSFFSLLARGMSVSLASC